MVTHEMIPAVDSQYPSSLSPAVIDGELRQKLGFQGVVITDSLVMGALNNRWTVAQAAALAIEAGADMVIGPQNAQVVAQVKDALKAAHRQRKTLAGAHRDLGEARPEAEDRDGPAADPASGLAGHPDEPCRDAHEHAEEEHEVISQSSLV